MELADSWQLISSLNWASPTTNSLPITLPHQFTAQVIRTGTTISGVSTRWYTAGYLSQTISLIPAEEPKSVRVPLNRRKPFALPLLRNSYQLTFLPVIWLPAGLSLQIWEYTGPPPDAALIQQLLFM